MINTTTRNRTHNTSRLTAITVFLSLFLIGKIAEAQLVYNESFNTSAGINTTTLALGWAQGKYGAGTDPDNYWDRRNFGVFPAIAPHTGNGMMRYLSWFIAPGEASFLSSKKLDLRNVGAIPGTGAPFNFWMYRDNGWAGYADRIQVYVNTTPDMAGAPVGPLVETVTSQTVINRDCALTPSTTCNTWQNYFYNVPTSFNGSGSVYIIILATSAFGNDIHIDDFTVTSYPNAQAYTAASAQVWFQNSTTTGKNKTDQMIIGARLTMDGATTPKSLTGMQFNTNGSDNPPTDITNAKLWFTGGTPSFSTDNAILLGRYDNPVLTNDTFLVANWANYLAPSLTTFNGLEHGLNYFWITYDIPIGAQTGNYVDAEWIDFELNGVAAATTVPTIQTMAGARLIDVLYCNTSYYTGTSWAGYNTNDFVQHVWVAGDNLPPPGVDNQWNTILAACGASAASGCSVGPFPKNCPFQCHPPDYELFAEVPGKTTTFTANGSTNYPITTQCGTYGGGNCIAAWIDYNKDGQFNNWFYEVNINCSGNAGSDTILLLGVGWHPGWRVGMNVAGTGIAPGATMVSVGYTPSFQVMAKLSTPNTGAVSGSVTFSAPDGEKISQSQYLAANGTYLTTFKVPNTSTSGKTRMRVREVWINYDIDPCLTFYYGECEDYVVTVIPDCPGYPGYTTWLGLTDNWADPSNWCPAIAPVSPNPFMSVRLPGGPTGVYTYYRPVIKSGVSARAIKLRIEANDTLYINAPTASSLTVQDSLRIFTASSALKVNTTLIDTAQVFNGTLSRPSESPVNNSLRSRSFLAFQQADLQLQGMITGDTITNIFMHIQRKSNGNPYKNFTVTMYEISTAAFGTGFAALVPANLTPKVVVWTGDLNPAAFVPVANGYGTIDLPLQTRWRWSGSANAVCVEICYDNVGFPSTVTNDEPRFTQTTSLRRYMSLRALTTFPKAGCSIVPQDYVTVTGTWVSGTSTITVASAAEIATVLASMSSYNDGRSVVSVNVPTLTITMNLPAFTSGTGVAINLANVQNLSGIYRPNLTFKFTRPYIKYPISVGGHWENNGTFTPAVSRVTFNGAVVNQQVAGTASTTFYDLDINNTNHVQRNTDFVVSDSLKLIAGRLKLNNGMVTLLNPAVSALTRTSGYIQAETDIITNNAFPYGRLYWKMGSTPGLRVIPFANTAGVSIPFDYNIDAGTHNVVIGTYNTQPNNTNLPLPEVTNIFGFDGTSYNSLGNAVVDRYYLVKDSLGVSPQADMTFRYATSERASTGFAAMSAQRWINATDLWEFPFIGGQTYTPNTPTAATDQLIITDFNAFNVNSWWTIVGTATPLPVSLLDFTAVPFSNKVQLKWTTASEENNSHFIVERTVNNNDFSFIGRVESKGPSTNILDYETWDYHPVEGIQYYYLRQHDYNGRVESYGPVAAEFSKNVFDIVTAMISSTDRGLTVVFNYNTTEPYSYRIVDMTGRLIVAKDKNPATPGSNVIDIDVDLAKGAYQIVLQNSEKVVSRKFFY